MVENYSRGIDLVAASYSSEDGWEQNTVPFLICDICGAVVANALTHTGWHSARRPAVAGLPDSNDGGLQ